MSDLGYQEKESKWGNVSLLLAIVASILSLTFIGEISIMDMMLNFISFYNCKFFLASSLFIISIYIGIKHKDDFGASIGVSISITLIIINFIVVILKGICK